MICALRNICIFICQAKTWEFKWENPKPIHSWYACSSRSSFFAKCTKKVREKWLETLIMNCIKRSRIFSTHNHGLRTYAQWSLVSLKFQTFGLGQTNWCIWGIFGRTISTHFGTVSPLSMFSIIQPLFLQKTKPLYPHPNGIWIFFRKELGILPSCVCRFKGKTSPSKNIST